MRLKVLRAPAVKTTVTPQLVALSEGPNISLDKPIVLIGRHQECDIQIPSRKISRRHCCIAQVADHLVVRDLGSTNGIRINGVKVLEGNLRVDDELIIGNMHYQVKWSADAEPKHAAPKNGIKAGSPPMKRKQRADDSLDVPMPLPDVAQSHPVLQGKPSVSPGSSEPNKAPPHPGLLDGPSDDIRLRPLDPPK